MRVASNVRPSLTLTHLVLRAADVVSEEEPQVAAEEKDQEDKD